MHELESASPQTMFNLSMATFPKVRSEINTINTIFLAKAKQDYQLMTVVVGGNGVDNPVREALTLGAGRH